MKLKLPDDFEAYGISLPREFQGAEGYARFKRLMNAIRNPKSPQDYEAAVAEVGGAKKALQARSARTLRQRLVEIHDLGLSGRRGAHGRVSSRQETAVDRVYRSEIE